MLYVFFHDESVSFPVRTTCEAAISAIQSCVFFFYLLQSNGNKLSDEHNYDTKRLKDDL